MMGGLGSARTLVAQRLRPSLNSNPGFRARLIQTGSKLRFGLALRVCHEFQINIQAPSSTSSLAKHPTKPRNLVDVSETIPQGNHVLEIPQGMNMFMRATGMPLHLHRLLHLLGPPAPPSISLSVALPLCVYVSASLCVCVRVCVPGCPCVCAA